MAIQNPVVLVPGITASNLRDEYDVDPQTVWSVLRKKYDRIALHPDNVQLERDQPARVAPQQVFDLPYGELIHELRHDLSRRADQPTPVYPFAYDWRQPLDRIEPLLAAFIDEVIGRTRLLGHYHANGYGDDARVDLVGHSMGGLIITGLLERQGAAARVGKVVTLGTPFRGSLEAPLKIATGLSALGTAPPSSREREVARLTPALYHLLPSFDGAVMADAPLPDDLFDPGAWQSTVVDTIAEYIRLHGLTKRHRRTQAQRLFAALLNEARKHRQRSESFHLHDAGLADDDWLCIIGIGETTRTHLQIKSRRGKPVFDLTSGYRRNLWPNEDSTSSVLTGDGTVPYLGARCAFIKPEKLICVTDDDFGYWELADRALEGPVGLHGMLPKMNLIHRLTVSHLIGKSRPGTWGRRPPDLPAASAWDPPIKRLKQK